MLSVLTTTGGGLACGGKGAHRFNISPSETCHFRPAAPENTMPSEICEFHLLVSRFGTAC